ncbi:BnaA04g11690D [Brassica napus]|uniref:(rape) hypothetical protein n=1 Tax=Brassica napus TaxID=3708 RepID=A0A078FSW0_BRANA|nr:unnamed protein product [Brassica napus]CDY15942.1 BnaA04g11690D [Brassica napus]
MMKLRLRRYETRETLEFELADTSNLHDLCHRISSSTPSSVHFSLNRNDKPSPKDTLRSRGMTPGDLIYYYSLHPSSPINIEIVAPAGSKRLSVPFHLKKVLLEKSGDESGLTILATSVHAVMLESGFLLLNNRGCFDKFTFSKDLLTVSLRYTLPELITKTRVEYVTVTFQSLSNTIVVYGSLGGRGCMVKRVSLNKNRFVSVIDLVVDTLRFEKQASCSSYRDVFTFWKMVKDGLSIPLMTCLCEKYGLELPPCLMFLPRELKMKILELVPGDSVAKMACVCAEMQCLASDDGLWKHKCLEEAKHLVVNRSSVSWKAEFAAFWKQRQKVRSDMEISRRSVTSPGIIAQSRADRISSLRAYRRQRRQR